MPWWHNPGMTQFKLLELFVNTFEMTYGTANPG